MTERRRLDNRRHHWLADVVHDGFKYTIGYGKFDDGTLAEVFLDASAKSGTAVEAAARDAAVTASIAFQYGTPVEVIRGAVSRDHLGNAAGPLGAALDLIAAGEAQP